VGCSRSYNVADLNFTWSTFLDGAGLKVRPRHATSRTPLFLHQRPGSGPVTGGGAHGPQGSSSGSGERLFRSQSVRPTPPRRGLCPARTDPAQEQDAKERARTLATDPSDHKDPGRRS
jgi:hypothetical protein